MGDMRYRHKMFFEKPRRAILGADVRIILK
jgi:hypothetical protein